MVLRDQGVLDLRPGFDPFTGTASLADISALRQKVELVGVLGGARAFAGRSGCRHGIVNSYAYQAGLIATRDGIAVEKRERNPYVNIIVVRASGQAAPWVPTLVAAYSPSRCASSSSSASRDRSSRRFEQGFCA